MSAFRPEPTLRSYLDVLRRRKWVVLAALLAATAVSVGMAMRKGALYESTSLVLLNQQSLSSALTNTTDPSAYLQPDRFAQTEVDLARQDGVTSVVVAEGRPAMRAAGVPIWTMKQFHDASTASVRPNANLLALKIGRAHV